MGENSFDKETVALIADSATSYYDELRKDPNGRFRSWEHCYSNFYRARQEEKPDIDYLSLQLAFYLASWGMYRGSSFLLQKDYRIHTPVVEEILEDKYDVLLGIECFKLKNPQNQKLLEELNEFLEKYYDKIRKSVKEQDVKNKLSSTLITKVLMGTMGCVPAYDRYFIDGIKLKKVATGNYNINSILKLVDFYEKNENIFEAAREHLQAGNIMYPQMKVLDMGFWKIGFDADENKGLNNLTK